MKVLTFNLHTQYLYLLSQTGWDIDNLIITPQQGLDLQPEGPWHTQPYGYPTFPGAVNAMPGVPYGGYFPEDINSPPALWMAPEVPNIKNVTKPADHYDMVAYLELQTTLFWQTEKLLAGTPPTTEGTKLVLVNLGGHGLKPFWIDDVVCHAPLSTYSYFPIAIVDDFYPRVDNTSMVLVNFGASKLRSAQFRGDILNAVGANVPVHLHDVVEDPWDYWKVRTVLAQFQVFLQLQNTPGGPPLSMLEAMASGMPAVIWDPHGHMNDYTHMVDCWKINNPMQAVVACKRLLSDSDLRKEIGEAGREHTLEKHGIDKFVASWKKVAGDD